MNNDDNQAGAARMKSEDWHRSILRAAMDGFWMVSPQGQLLEVNNAYCRMSGYSEPELLAMSIPDLEVFETGTEVAARIAKIMELGQFRFETRHRRKDGSIFDVEVSAQHCAGEDGQFFAFLRDISEQKRTALALQQEQGLYEDLVNTLPAGAYRLRARTYGDWRTETWRAMAQGQYSLDFASDRFCAILGITHQTLAADPGVVSDLIHPADKEDFDAKNAQAMRDFNPFIWEGRIINHQQTRWIHFESLPRLIDPETVLWTGIAYDITDLKQTMKEREQFYQFFQTSTDLMCLADPLGYFLKTNPSFTETLGYSEAELQAKPIIDFIHPDDRQATLDEIARQQQRGYTVNFENRYLCKDGSVKWLSWRVSYSKNEGIAYATARDVTDKKRAEETLRENEERMSLAMQAGNMGLYDLNVQTGEVVVNPEYALMLGYDPAEFHETNARWIERLHPDDRGKVAAVYQAYVRGELPEYKVEFRQKTRDGSWKWILSYGRIMERDADGNPRRMLGVHVDIHEHKQTEQALRERKDQLRVIFNTSQAGIILVGAQGTILLANNRMAEMFGMSLSQLVGSSYTEHLHPAERELGDERMKQLIRGDIQSVAVERHYLRADGSDFWGFLSGKRIENPDGSLRALVGIIADLTEQKKLQEQLGQAQKMESVGRLAGGVAHDFNNMLSVILGHTELARAKATDSPPLREHLEQIQLATERSAAIVRQLLAFARKQAVTPSVLDLNETVESMLKMLRRLIGENIDLVWLPGKALWPVKIDPAQIDQILANLCVNARDAVADIGRITIETTNVSADSACCADRSEISPGEYVLLTVSDDGCGMDEETRHNIFEPFFTTKEVGQGTGLGLAMVYGIVKQNAGGIDVESEPGRGTRFRIYLPRHLGEGKEARTGTMDAASRGHETILLVEDEPAILDLGKELLEMQGYRVLAASTPGEALRLAEEHSGKIHLLLTDVIMPAMNGRELAEKLLAFNPGLKKLFMSGYTAEVIAHRGVLDAGMKFIQKPFSLTELTTKVRAALDD